MAEQCRRDIRNPWARGSLAGVSAAILAGGLGTRLRPVVADRPKVLAQVGGRPFVAYLLDQLSQAGIQSAILCTGYLGEQVEAAFGARYGSLRLTYSRERSPRGTAGALRLALPLFESPSVLVLNGDSYCEADLPAFWSWHGAREAKATILLRHMPDTSRYGRVGVDGDGRVLGFSEKGAQAGPGWINAGAYILTRQLIGTIPATGPVSLEREVFPAWIGHGLYGCRGDGVVLDIGTPEAYTGACAWRPGPR